VRALRRVADWWKWELDRTSSVHDDMRAPELHWEDFQTAVRANAPSRLLRAIAAASDPVGAPADIFDSIEGNRLVCGLHGTTDGSESKLLEYTTPDGKSLTVLLMMVSPIVNLPHVRLTPLGMRSPGDPPSSIIRVHGGVPDSVWCIDTADTELAQNTFTDDSTYQLLRENSGRIHSIELGAKWLLIRCHDLPVQQMPWLLDAALTVRNAVPVAVLDEFVTQSRSDPVVIDIRESQATWLVRPTRCAPKFAI
jgi:hypothetical protein